MANFILDAGISQLAWRACDALRMRVSMSAMGSLIVMVVCSLPAGLGHTRDLASQGELPEADAAQCETTHEGAWPTAQLAAIVALDFESRRPLGLGDH